MPNFGFEQIHIPSKLHDMKKGFLLVSILLIISTLQFAKANSNNEQSGPQPQHASASEAYLRALRGHQVTGTVNFSDVIRAANQTKAMLTTKNSNNLNWTSLGPDNYGGKTKGLIYDVKDASGQTLYAGATGGGIWKSTNGGITWNPVGHSNMMVSSMVQNAAGDIYVGTGDGFNAQNASVLGDLGYTTGFMGNGIWKSTDGVTYTQLSATVPQLNNNNAEWAFINELALNSNGHIFAATNSGLRYSTDGGSSWNYAKINDGNPLSGDATDVQIASDGTIAAAISSNIYIAKNGPDSFELKSTDTENMLPTINVTRAELAFAPSNPSVVYAALAKANGSHIGIYRSTDKGETWSVILPETNTVNIYGGRGNYNNYITVFPNDPDKVLVGGVNLWAGKKVVEGGLFAWDVESIAGGAGFLTYYLHFGQERLVFKPGSGTEFFVATDGGVQKGSVNGDDLVFEINNRNYITTQFYSVAPTGQENRFLAGSQDQGTIYVSSTGNSPRQGETVHYADFPGGPCVVSTINPDAIVVTTRLGVMERSEDMAFTFSNQFKPVENMNPQAYVTPVALWESYEDQLSGDSVTFKAKKAYNGGETIKVKSKNFDQPFYYKLPAGQNLNQGDSLRVKDIVTTKLFIATANKIWMTREFLNFGKLPEWYEISNTTVGFNGIPQSIAVSKDGNHVFVGTKDGKLFRISNIAIAYNYERAHVGSPGCVIATRQMDVFLPGTSTPVSQAITSISIDPSNPNNVILTLGNYGNDHYIFGSTNALDANPTFTSKQGNLPKMPVYASMLEMSNSGLAIIGTEFGLFQTENVFASSPGWTADENMSNLPVFDLKQQLINKSADTLQLINGPEVTVKDFPGTNNLGIIYAATFGRGIYRCNAFRKPVGLDEPIPAANTLSTIRVYPNPVRSTAVVDFELTQAGKTEILIIDQQGRVVLTQQLGQLAAGKQIIPVNTEALKAGSYLLQLRTTEGNRTTKFLVY